MAQEEIVVDFTEGREKPAWEIRSTLLTTSIQAIRARGRYDAFAKAVPEKWRETILTVVAGSWLPLEVGAAHYAACDKLGFSVQDQFQIGREVGARIQGTVLGLFVRTARTSGATPWTGLSQCNRLYERVLKGGSVRLVKLGPKEARIEIVNNTLVAHSHFRNGLRGIVCAGGELFAEKVYVHELPRHTTSKDFGMRVSWA
jgi:hypothetical protein